MTYSEFINSLIAPIHTFFDCFGSLINSLLNNYIIITILGLSLFVVFFYSLKSIFFVFLSSKNYDDIADKKRGIK